MVSVRVCRAACRVGIPYTISRICEAGETVTAYGLTLPYLPRFVLWKTENTKG